MRLPLYSKPAPADIGNNPRVGVFVFNGRVRRLRSAPFFVRSGTSFPYPAFEAKAAPFPPTPLGRLYGKNDGEARCNNPGFFVTPVRVVNDKLP